MAKVFISYRRHDESAYAANTLKDKIEQRYGAGSVFLDVDNIPLGVDFRKHLGEAVGQCNVLLALMGEGWLGAGPDGKSALHSPRDYVRIEIESALKREIPVVPVLVGEAQMPSAEDLPESIRELVFRNAAEVRAGPHLQQHIEHVVRGLGEVFAAENRTSQPSPIVPMTVTQSPQPQRPVEPPASQQPVRRTGPPPLPTSAGPPPFPQAYSIEAACRQLRVIQNALGNFVDSRIYLAPNIPIDRVRSAFSSYARCGDARNILLLYDNTLWGNAKDGLCLTPDSIYYHNFGGASGRVPYQQIGEIQRVDGVISSSLRITNHEITIALGSFKNIATALTNVLRAMARPQ